MPEHKVLGKPVHKPALERKLAHKLVAGMPATSLAGS
jgi:hypothetical protein